MQEPDAGKGDQSSEPSDETRGAPSSSRQDRAREVPTGSFPGSELLSGEAPAKILSKLIDGDPLEIARACHELMAERGYLLDGQKLVAKSVARVAYGALDYRGEPSLAVWIRDRIEAAMRDLINEDREAERSGIPPELPLEARFELMSDTLGVELSMTRRVTMIFNDLPENLRRAFFAVVIEGKSINRFVAEGNGPPTTVKELLKRTFAALSIPRDHGDLGGGALDE